MKRERNERWAFVAGQGCIPQIRKSQRAHPGGKGESVDHPSREPSAASCITLCSMGVWCLWRPQERNSLAFQGQAGLIPDRGRVLPHGRCSQPSPQSSDAGNNSRIRRVFVNSQAPSHETRGHGFFLSGGISVKHFLTTELLACLPPDIPCKALAVPMHASKMRRLDHFISLMSMKGGAPGHPRSWVSWFLELLPSPVESNLLHEYCLSTLLSKNFRFLVSVALLGQVVASVLEILDVREALTFLKAPVR